MKEHRQLMTKQSVRRMMPNRERLQKVVKIATAVGRHPSSLLMAATISEDMGHRRSRQRFTPVDNDGRPLPWYTYPAIEYLSQFDFRDKNIFEWGSGNSSLFWARRSNHVTSIEDNRDWFGQVDSNMLDNQTLHLVEDREAYVRAIADEGRSFDVIVIDGSHRYECANVATQYLNKGGMVVFDNSDWWPKSTRALRDGDLIQADLTGFGPINLYTWTTSIFLHRDFRGRPLDERQPRFGIGAITKTANEG